MKYILSKEEYEAMNGFSNPLDYVLTHKRISEDDLQKLCTKICNQTPKSNGCLLDTAEELSELDPDEVVEVMCDDCPALAICPYDGKSFSQ